MAQLRITQTRSVIKTLEHHKRTIEALGLGRIRKVVLHDDTPAIRGMVRAVAHLVSVEEVK